MMQLYLQINSDSQSFCCFLTAWMHAEFLRVIESITLFLKFCIFASVYTKELLICFMSPLLQIMHGAADLRKRKALFLYFWRGVDILAI